METTGLHIEDIEIYPKPINVLFIAHDSMLYGGANYALFEMIDCLTKYNNVNAIILVPSAEGEFVNKLKNNGMKYVVFPYLLWAYPKSSNTYCNVKNWFKLLKTQFLIWINMKKLICQLKEYDSNLIHSNSSVVNIGAWISHYMGLPHVWHVREFGEEDYNFSYIFGSKHTRKIMSKYSTKILTISQILYKKYEKYVPNTKLKVVYDGISTLYDNAKVITKQEKQEFTVLIAGTIHKGKGQLEAVEAVCYLIKKNIPIRLILAGIIGDKEYQRKIEQTIVNNNSINQISYVGHVSDMNSLRKTVDVELICSEMEGFGRVTVEAMLSMNPIIGANCGGTLELINDGINGFLYEKGSYKELANKILELYNNQNMTKEMGMLGYKLAKEKFTEQLNAENVDKVYQEIIG